MKALRTGCIRATEDGLIDSDQADRDWAVNTHPASKAPRAVLTAVGDDHGFARARTVREHYEALIAKHDYEQRAAQLLNAAEVKIATVQVLRQFKQAMLEIPEPTAEEFFREPAGIASRLSPRFAQLPLGPDRHRRTPRV